MAIVAAGSFDMGDTFAEGSSSGLPVHTVYVSAFYMDQYELTKELWDVVYSWAISHGYTFDDAGSGKAADHPVHTINWYDAVKWCNARSEMEKRTPAYYTDTRLKKPYRSGQVEPYVNWNAGYRLPTEAEWEKAARGGANGHRFAWSDTDEITHSLANYNSTTNHYGYDTSYDTSPTPGYHPAYNDGVVPYTSPVGSFAPNGYGLYDMTGNVFEWVWDWADNTGTKYYTSSPATDPHGPDTGTFRLLRGGSWDSDSWWGRSAARTICNGAGKVGFNFLGFRSVLPAGQ
jgi:formylglycine-generating enzyme required for sulfatase activity